MTLRRIGSCLPVTESRFDELLAHTVTAITITFKSTGLTVRKIFLISSDECHRISVAYKLCLEPMRLSVMKRISLLLTAMVLLAGCRVKQASGPMGVGGSPPPIVAEGWLNGAEPSDSELAGKVVVIDVWAYW